jgi:biopolymer transport protein ExbD
MYDFKNYWKKSTITFKRRVQIKKGTIDVAPLIDVIFLLLIFFMLTSGFVSQPGIEVKLPRALTGQVLQRETIVLIITEDDKIYLNNDQITFSELKDQLQQIDKETQSLMIKADRQASVGQIVEVWDLCRELGILQVNIATTARE